MYDAGVLGLRVQGLGFRVFRGLLQGLFGFLNLFLQFKWLHKDLLKVWGKC